MAQVSKKTGEMAMEYISDYPLYASTCGITYEQAVKIAKALLGTSWKHEIAEIQRFESLTPEEMEKEFKQLRKEVA